MNKNYNEIFLHNIFAIIEPDIDVVYVAKTTIKIHIENAEML